MNRARTLVIGVGNEFRGDDAVGLLVVRALRAGPLGSRTDVELQDQRGDAATLMESWADRDCVIVVDAAMKQHASTGTILRMTGNEFSMPSGVEPRTSSHVLSLMQAVELGRVMNRLPERLWIYCVIGADFSRGTSLSAEVSAALPVLVAEIESELGG